MNYTLLKDLFASHTTYLQKQYDDIFAELSMQSLLIDAGILGYYFQDDQSYPFRSSHHFAHWCPLTGPGHIIELRAGEKPRLFALVPDDFWHEHRKVGDEFWTEAFDIYTMTSREDIWQAVKLQKGASFYIGPCEKEASDNGYLPAPEGLDARLNWGRSFKTDYEIECLVEASRLGAKAHIAAEQCFKQGGSELDIYNAYLQAIRVTQSDLPYNAIVCLNEKGAFLHYEAKRDAVKNGNSLLIDSGASFQGYASDITRTYASSNSIDDFKSLISSVNRAQLELVSSVKAGLSMGDLHYQSHVQLAQILLDHGIISGLSIEDSIEHGITKVFYPHGVGHMLGLLVHDVGGQQSDRVGTPCDKDPRMPKLRSLRTLEDRHVITVEPGLYFIDTLLQKEKNSDRSVYFNWELIEILKPYGGIRIEDNVLVSGEGHRNMTREFLR